MKKSIIICICLSVCVSLQMKAQNILGELAGALLGGGNDICSNCNGAGCSVCNGIGSFSTSSDYFKKGFEMGMNMTKSNSPKQSAPMNGFHTKQYSDGTYKGNFKNGKMHGQGTFLFNNGTKYVGSFVNGKVQGKGTMTYPNGDKYVGDFFDNMKQGKGTLTCADGDKYVGDFKNNNPEGQGTYTVPKYNLKYVGSIKNGTMNGEGIMYHTKEKTFEKGIFKDGELIQVIERGTYTEPKKAAPTAKRPAGKARRK